MKNSTLIIAVLTILPVVWQSKSSATTLALYGSALPVTSTNGQNLPQDSEYLESKSSPIDGLTTGNTWAIGGFLSRYRSQFAGNSDQWVNMGGSTAKPDQGWYYTNTSLWIAGSTETDSTANSTTGHEFKLTADAGSTINLSSLSFDWNIAINSSTATMIGYANIYAAGSDGVYYSLLANDASLSVTGAGSGATAYGDGTTITATSIPTELLGQTELTVRILFATNVAGSTSSAMFIRNIQANGDIVAIPEPAGVLLGVAGLAFTMLRRRKQGHS